MIGLFWTGSVFAKPNANVKFSTIRAESPRPGKETLILPYAFSTESMGLTFGVGGALKGHLQEQLLFGGTAFASLEEAAGGFLGMWDLRLPGTQRFFFSAMGMSSYFTRQRAYVGFNLKPGEIRAGTNE